MLFEEPVVIAGINVIEKEGGGDGCVESHRFEVGGNFVG